MTGLVVLVLVIVWVVVLAPSVIRHFREGGSKSSIESFHEKLHLLERTGPKLVAPAYRLGTGEHATAGGGVAPGGSPPFRRAGPGSRADLVLLGTGAEGSDVAGASVLAPGGETSARRRRLADQRRRSRKRRRDILLALLTVATATGILGAMHALHLLWAVTGVSVLAIAAYVALVAYAQLLNAERHAARPVASEPLPVTPAWAARAPRHAAGGSLPGVEVLTSGAPQLARAGYPGAWDDEERARSAPRHAAAAH